ncbi:MULTISPECIES: SulP family inorganic anion transporter [Prochlorococcus]|uniref:Sulfate permease n=1 Tax=Prochlorococcus marinus str. MIT 9116 TaxID=167544 RepID=A0A0A1ZN47_PROMR|nr:SulP family inorganic anion transporter [Prochlorococcus marinus]KGF89195.1 Sulfate permease [Prochlorococcus marinus str. MIT 9107]KGF89951.1 Sulfate permease [Prochlorococcus marinus str. MIT 9116]KGF95386.1 Sulfate permease [Prochlorococcus marinus str. MIT 9123]
MKIINGFHLKNIRGDILGGITAAVVALPLALAFGNAALGPGGAIYGLYGAVVVGFLAALFGGTPAQVSGPTGPMSVTVAGVVAGLAAVGVPRDLSAGQILPLVMAAVVIGGLLQIAFGILKLGKYITLVPYSVVSGFMSGIGVIIIALQIGPLLGISTRGGVVDSLSTVFSNFEPNGAAIGVAIMTLAIVFLTPRKITQWVPSPLLALLIVTPISIFFGGTIDRIGEIPRGVPSLDFPSFNQYFPIIFKAGLVLAVLGAIDSLLTSLVADNISQTKHNSDRELIGQGIGNAVAGLFSGLPGAGATMRTVINVKSGGSTPLSGMVHSIVLLIVLVGAGPLAEQIPTALLAGILIKVGLDIIDWGFLLRAHKLSLKTSVVMYGVLLMTVFWDLIWAVLVGVFIANMLTIDSITETQLEGMEEDNPSLTGNNQVQNTLPTDEKALLDRCSGEVMLFRLKGPLSFGAAKGISDRMNLVRNYKILILDITDVPRLGVTATLAIEDMMQEAKNNSRKAFVAGANEKVRERLSKFGVDGIIETRKQALEKALNELT